MESCECRNKIFSYKLCFYSPRSDVSDTQPAAMLQFRLGSPLLSTIQFLGKPWCVCLADAKPHSQCAAAKSCDATGMVGTQVLTQVQSAEDLAAYRQNHKGTAFNWENSKKNNSYHCVFTGGNYQQKVLKKKLKWQNIEQNKTNCKEAVKDQHVFTFWCLCADLQTYHVFTSSTSGTLGRKGWGRIKC